MFLFALQSGLESFATDQYEYPEISCRMDEYLNMESGASQASPRSEGSLHIAGFRMHFDKVVRKFNEMWNCMSSASQVSPVSMRIIIIHVSRARPSTTTALPRQELQGKLIRNSRSQTFVCGFMRNGMRKSFPVFVLFLLY